MEQESSIKKIDFLDEERRKQKTVIASIEQRIDMVDGNVQTLIQQVKEITAELSHMTVLLGRLDQFDEVLAQNKVEMARLFDDLEKRRVDHELESDKLKKIEMEGVNRSISELRKGFDQLTELKKAMQARVDEEFRLGRKIEEVVQTGEELQKSKEEFVRSQRLIEENRRQESKRITDIQGELAALRKRTEELRGRSDLNTDSLKKLETKVNELLSQEVERRQLQNAMMEKMAVAQVERDRIWKEWQSRFEVIEKQATTFELEMQSLDETHRAVKNSQNSLDEVIQRMERRINEFTEMQRLAEERARQDWAAFKTDDQKRWTNYTLSQDEQMRENNRLVDKINERVTNLEDAAQEMQDILHFINEENAKRLQTMMANLRDWMDDHENYFGKPR
jgi:chromosome segregation ATPase